MRGLASTDFIFQKLILMKVRTRFAPSPTGYLHIGGARTALFNWLYAKKYQGDYFLRIEDTDQERSDSEFTQDILSSLKWLGINSDTSPIIQSKRTGKYKQAINQLLERGHAYYCYCSKDRLQTLRENQMKNKQKPRYDGFCRNLTSIPNSYIKPVVRFKNPLEGSVEFIDHVRGKITVQNNELDDLILARSDGSPTYHLTVVVDDIDLNITNIIRGDDHLNNTPRQINIFKAFNNAIPEYAHIPLIHGKDGKRLSKRHGAVSVSQYKKDGILPNALLNYLIRLGWSHGDKELFTLDEMVKLFDFSSIQQSASIFDVDKLLWVNQQHMMNTSGKDISATLKGYFASCGVQLHATPDIAKVFDVQKKRYKNLNDLCHASLYFYYDFEKYDEKACSKNFTENSADILLALKDGLSAVDNWDAKILNTIIKNVADQLNLKLGKVAPVLRVAVTGRSDSPSIDITLELLGKQKTLIRVNQAIEYIKNSL